jgi:O-antigen/teichoic acid export membrane protein
MTNIRCLLAISLLQKYVMMGLALVSNIILARLLTPDEIGIYTVSFAAIGLRIIDALGTQFRGALVVFASVEFFISEKRQKILIGLGMTLLTAAILAFMPEFWSQRMGTIQTYEEEMSQQWEN